MSRESQEIMETTVGNVNHDTVETMDSEDTGEVQYVYDESQMILGTPDDFSNITDLVLEDGTRAMIVNGTLVTADGQTLILQDGSDLSQYYVDENTDQIILSQEQEEQFLEIISPHDSQQEEQQMVRYVRGSGNTPHVREEILYIHEDEQVLPIQEQYQLAEVDPEYNGVPMQVIKLENQQVVEEMDGVIDLEQFLTQQGLVQLEDGNYQYAVLKDGKFHIQTMNDPSDEKSLKDQNGSNVVNEAISEPSTELSYLDLSTIKGKDINTGEPITLSKYMNKVYTKNKKQDCSFRKENSKSKSQEKNIDASTSTEVRLRNLLNKKITIGRTDKGKLLVGKIINVTKKIDCENAVGKRTIRRKIVLPSKEKKKNIVNVTPEEVINLVDDEDADLSKHSSGKNLQKQIACVRTGSLKISPMPSLAAHPDRAKGLPIANSKPMQSTNSTVTSVPESREREKADKKSPDSTKDNTPANVETSPEQSKIVVHKKVVTKDCFEVISRTLTGLMNMESVVRKLKNKAIIIKIIEKNYNRDSGDYVKSISYCTGYMVREYKLNEEADNFSESWKFIPDTNSQDTLLGKYNTETSMQEPLAERNNLKKIANLTIQITINPQGSRTTRVIINPPNMYRCKECTKSFRTSSALKVHISEYHYPVSFSLECTACSIKFRNYQESKEHFQIHEIDDNKGMYECMECNKRFGSSLLLRRHMEIHFKPVNCRHCNQCFSNLRDLKKHLPVHEPVVLQPPSVPTILKKGPHDIVGISAQPPEQRIYCCHICGRQFSRHSNLQRHIEIHQGEGAMYKCAICNCSYHYVSSLTRHVVTCHVDTTNKRSQSVQNHIKKQESNTRPEAQFLQDDQIVEMIRLEDMTSENLHYVTETIGNVTKGLSIGEGIEVLQIPVDEGGVVVED